MLRSPILQPSFKRLFTTTNALSKKARRLPIKRLIVPVEQRADEMHREQGLMKQQLNQQRKEQKYKEFQERSLEKLKRSGKYKASQKIAKDRSMLPVLESFTKDDLSDGANLIGKITEFSELNLLPEVREAVMAQICKETVLRADNYETKRADEEELSAPKPTPIQVIAIHRMAKQLMENNVKTYTIAAETGSGKTWAYLAPLVDFLKRQEQAEDWETMKDKAIIRAVILLPTHELVDQVYNSVKGLEESLGLHTFAWLNVKHQGFIDAVKNRIDILVTTPGKLSSIDKIRDISRPEHLFAHTRFVVADEADTLMDRSFVEMTHGSLKMMPRLNRLVLCSATVSDQYSDALKKLFPEGSSVQSLISPRTHTTPKSVKFTMIDSEVAPYQGSKMKALAQALYAIHKDGTERSYEKRCVVFVNGKHDAVDVAKVLKNKYGHDAFSLTGEDTPEERKEKISIFVNPPRHLDEVTIDKTPVEEYTVPGSNIVLKRNTEDPDAEDSSKRMKVLVTTDLAARGINFYAVRNVILYHSPNTSVDLLHRIGRTGRMGQSGRVIVIMDKKTKPWVKALVKNKEKK